MRKTLKREAALFLIAALVAFAGFAIWPGDPELIRARAAVVSALAIPILTFAAAAFGMDWVAKQTDWGGDRVPGAPADWPADIVPPSAPPS